MSDLPINAPSPRLCHIVKWPDFDGYGFNLHADKSRPGQYIGKVDENSPADVAGLKESDRIIEVNGVNISNENHKQVVQRIKAISNETRLLVVDSETDRWYKTHNLVVRGDQPNIVFGTSQRISPSPESERNGLANEEDDKSVASAESTHSESSTQPQDSKLLKESDHDNKDVEKTNIVVEEIFSEDKTTVKVCPTIVVDSIRDDNEITEQSQTLGVKCPDSNADDKQVEPPSTAQNDLPSTAPTDLPSTAQTDPPSTAQTDPPSTAQTDPPSTAQTEPLSTAQTEPPSAAQTEPSSTVQTEPPSTAQDELKSNVQLDPISTEKDESHSTGQVEPTKAVQVELPSIESRSNDLIEPTSSSIDVAEPHLMELIVPSLTELVKPASTEPPSNILVECSSIDHGQNPDKFPPTDVVETSSTDLVAPGLKEAESPLTELVKPTSTELVKTLSTHQDENPALEQFEPPSYDQVKPLSTEQVEAPSTDQVTFSTKLVEPHSTELVEPPSNEQVELLSKEQQVAPPSTREIAPSSTEQVTSSSTEQVSPSTELVTPSSTEQAALSSTEQVVPSLAEQVAPSSTEHDEFPPTEQVPLDPSEPFDPVLEYDNIRFNQEERRISLHKNSHVSEDLSSHSSCVSIPLPASSEGNAESSVETESTEEISKSPMSTTPSPPPSIEPEVPPTPPIEPSEEQASSPEHTPEPKIHSPEPKAPTPEPQTKPMSEAFKNSGLNLNMTAAEMRAHLASKKKFDPRKDSIDLKKKYQIIQNM